MEQVTESRRKPIVVGIGELLWDMLPSGKKAGGAPINFVYHASCLGAEGYAISAVGDDELGKEIVDELDKNHIQHLFVRKKVRGRFMKSNSFISYVFRCFEFIQFRIGITFLR